MAGNEITVDVVRHRIGITLPQCVFQNSIAAATRYAGIAPGLAWSGLMTFPTS